MYMYMNMHMHMHMHIHMHMYMYMYMYIYRYGSIDIGKLHSTRGYLGLVQKSVLRQLVGAAYRT